MENDIFDNIEEKLKRDLEKKDKMKITGKSVFDIQKIIKGKLDEKDEKNK